MDAWKEDDESAIMALSHKSKPIYGVQFHPEVRFSLFLSFLQFQESWFERALFEAPSRSTRPKDIC